jgi:hypothetical protein
MPQLVHILHSLHSRHAVDQLRGALDQCTGAVAGRRHYAHGGAEALAALRDVTQLQQQDCVTAGWAGRVGAFVAPGASA